MTIFQRVYNIQTITIQREYQKKKKNVEEDTLTVWERVDKIGKELSFWLITAKIHQKEEEDLSRPWQYILLN